MMIAMPGIVSQGGGPKLATITITGKGDTSACYLMIDGVKYTSAVTLNVPIGTTIDAHIFWGKSQGAIYLNGVKLVDTTGTAVVTDYTYIVSGNVQIKLNTFKLFGSITEGIIEITE